MKLNRNILVSDLSTAWNFPYFYSGDKGAFFFKNFFFFLAFLRETYQRPKHLNIFTVSSVQQRADYREISSMDSNLNESLFVTSETIWISNWHIKASTSNVGS